MPELGTQFAGYRIDDVVGRGGMGVVYRATELALDRPVALKLIAPELASDASFRERFLGESRLAASIDHAGILPVYAAGEADGELYLANRFVEGTDLGAIVEQGPLPAERALGLVGQVADALDAAHARGLVHRDVKPGNVLVDAADHCYLSDFGLTTQLGDRGPTASGLAGSLDYLAPEQIRRGEVDGRTDQYALSCVLYELLSGAPPFRRETEAQTLWAHMQEEASPLAAYPELESVFARALAKEPEQRYESCDAFVDEARAALGLGPSPIAVRRRRRRIGGRLLYGGAALIALAAVAAVLVLTLGSGETLVAPPNSLGVVDPVSQELVQAIPVGNTPTEVAASDEWVWVLNSNDGGTISRIDARDPDSRLDVLGRRDTSVFPVRVRLALGRDGRRPGLSRRGGHRSRRRRAGRFGMRVRKVPSSSTRVRAGSRSERTQSGPAAFERSRASIQLLRRWRRGRSEVWGPMAYGFGSLWVLGPELARLSPGTMRAIATVELPGSSVDIATGLGSVWVADEDGEAVLRVDPREESISRTYDVGGIALGVTVGADAVWAASEAGTVSRIDPRTDEVTTIAVGGAPRRVDEGAGAVWVSVE